MNSFLTSRRTRFFGALLCIGLTALASTAHASRGTEGAAFLNIPVGARPAAMGSAYAALADDAYAPVWNPGGLGSVSSLQLAGQHISYLESMRYEFASIAIPWRGTKQAFGVSAQYLTSGDIAGTDENGGSIGDYSTHYGAYTLAYGRQWKEGVSFGVAGKAIRASISDVSATAFAADLGGVYRANNHLTYALTLTNLGSRLRFLNDGDALPLTGRAGIAWRAHEQWVLASDVSYRKEAGRADGHLGVEWRPLSAIALRAGYRTETSKELSNVSGVSTGIGLRWGFAELAYAFLPYGDLGTTQYFSMLLKWGSDPSEKRNLVRYPPIRKHQNAHWAEFSGEFREMSQKATDEELIELLGLPDKMQAAER